VTPDPVDVYPQVRHAIRLDDAFEVDEGRTSTAAATLYRALMESLEPQDQQWVLEAVARQRQAEAEAEARGESIARPTW
jgi:hypothetical protein